MAKVRLHDIVSLPAFESAGDLFHKATKMTFSFPGRDGNTVFYPIEDRCSFCQYIQSTEEGRRRCQKSDEKAAEAALREGRPMYYTCHAGLVDVVVPVVSGDDKIGCFYSGQSLLAEATEEGFDKVKKNVAELGLDPERLREEYYRVPQVDAYRLEMAMELLAIISTYLVQGQTEIKRERDLRRSAVQRARLERDLREMELRLSQAQLNPHFLFNSLNLILGEALNENAGHTARLVEELADLLSNALTSIGSMVSLEAEMASCEAYVDIFRARFSGKIDLRIDLPRPLARIKVPALILQPLVENALVHAYDRNRKQFTISISAARRARNLEIRVNDNGPGLTPKQLAAVRRSLRTRGHAGKMTGLMGLSRRLKYYYNTSNGLQLDQSESGLTVLVSIPA